MSCAKSSARNCVVADKIKDARCVRYPEPPLFLLATYLRWNGATRRRRPNCSRPSAMRSRFRCRNCSRRSARTSRKPSFNTPLPPRDFPRWASRTSVARRILAAARIIRPPLHRTTFAPSAMLHDFACVQRRPEPLRAAALTLRLAGSRVGAVLEMTHTLARAYVAPARLLLHVPAEAACTQVRQRLGDQRVRLCSHHAVAI